MLPIRYDEKITIATPADVRAIIQSKPNSDCMARVKGLVAHRDDLLKAFHEPEFVTKCLEAVRECVEKYDVYSRSRLEEAAAIVNLMLDVPAFMEQLRKDKDLSNIVGHKAWSI